MIPVMAFLALYFPSCGLGAALASAEDRQTSNWLQIGDGDDVDGSGGAAGGDGVMPPGRRSHAMAIDPERNNMLVFGGYGNGSHLGDTWIFGLKNSTWIKVDSVASPSPRAATTLVYEQGYKRFVLFGGFNYGHSLVSNETWAFDTLTDNWINLNSRNPPEARASYGMLYDSKREAVVLFGGFTEKGYFSDIWMYEPKQNIWRQEMITGDSSPAPRGAMGFTYDETDDVYVMYGGFSDSGFFGDTWTFNPTTKTWKEMSPDDHPPLVRTRMVYDSEAGESIFFGGDVAYADTVEAAVAPYNGVWAYNYSANRWREISFDEANSPLSRSLNGIAYDPSTSSIFIFGGTDALIDDQNFAGREFGDLWVLPLGADSEIVEPPGSAQGGFPESTIMIIVAAVTIVGAAGAAATIIFLRRKH